MADHVAVNAAWQLDGDARLVRAATQAPSLRPSRAPRVVGYVEMRDRHDRPVDAASILDDGWDVNQDLSDGEASGSACAVRDTPGWTVKHGRGFLGSLPGFKVQARRVVETVIRHTEHGVPYVDHMLVGHAPLRSTGRQDDFDRSVRRRVRRIRAQARAQRLRPTARRVVHRWAYLGDANVHHTVIRRALGGAHSVGVDVMAGVYSVGWGDVTATDEHLPGSDHHLLRIHTTRG